MNPDNFTQIKSLMEKRAEIVVMKERLEWCTFLALYDVSRHALLVRQNDSQADFMEEFGKFKHVLIEKLENEIAAINTQLELL